MPFSATGVLSEVLEKFPEPEYDWRFRAGRIAEETAMLREAFRKILKKKPNAVSANEAADMAVEFQAIAVTALSAKETEG